MSMNKKKFIFYKMSMKNYINLGIYSVIIYFTVGLMIWKIIKLT